MSRDLAINHYEEMIMLFATNHEISYASTLWKVQRVIN